MTSREIKQKAHRFLAEFRISTLTLADLRTILAKQGFTIIEFNHILNDEPVDTVIHELQLTDLASRSKGFTYVDNHSRLVFVHEDLTDQEKLTVLLHEEGHIYCSHLNHSPVIGINISEEHEANEFSHYVLYPNPGERITRSMRAHPKTVSLLSLLLLLLAIAGFSAQGIAREKSYYGDFYVTATGNKYHEEDCIFIKDKTSIRRLTLTEFESGTYEPCQVCLPHEDASGDS